MAHIICINGMPRSGKSTFAEMAIQNMGLFGMNISTVDFVKKVATYCGWDGTKTPQNREFLSNLKDVLTEWNDVPYNDIVKRIETRKDQLKELGLSTELLTVFIHVREPKEIKKFVDRIGAKTLLIRRPAVETCEQSNHADAEVMNYNYDYIIHNEGDLEELNELSQQFIAELIGEGE